MQWTLGESPELIELGEVLDLNMLTHKCNLMYAQPVRGFHSITRVTGQL